MELQVVPTKADVRAEFVRTIAGQIRNDGAKRQPTTLILPVGPTAGYPLLAEYSVKERLSWRDVHIVLMDEYLDWTGRLIACSDPLSFRGFMERFCSSLGDLAPEPPLVFPDPQHLERVENYVAELGGIDLCVGGVGINGHVAFNEPAGGFRRLTVAQLRECSTRIVPLNPETVVMNASRSEHTSLADFPTMAVTIGMATIRAARRIRLFCESGAWQTPAVLHALSGSPDPAWPVTLLFDHPDALLVADAATAPAGPGQQ